MSHWQPAAYKDYQWIVADPQLLGGKLAIRGTRLGVDLILECESINKPDPFVLSLSTRTTNLLA